MPNITQKRCSWIFQVETHKYDKVVQVNLSSSPNFVIFFFSPRASGKYLFFYGFGGFIFYKIEEFRLE